MQDSFSRGLQKESLPENGSPPSSSVEHTSLSLKETFRQCPTLSSILSPQKTLLRFAYCYSAHRTITLLKHLWGDVRMLVAKSSKCTEVYFKSINFNTGSLWQLLLLDRADRCVPVYPVYIAVLPQTPASWFWQLSTFLLSKCNLLGSMPVTQWPWLRTEPLRVMPLFAQTFTRESPKTSETK